LGWEMVHPSAHRTWPARIVQIVRRDVPLAVLDAAIVVVGYLGPLVLRFDGAVPGRYWDQFWGFVPLAILVHLLSNYLFGLYGQMWRYASVQEARRMVLAGVAAGLLLVGGDAVIGGPVRPVPLSVVVLGAALSLMGFGAVRFQSRLFAFRRRSMMSQRTRLLLVGAGDAGAAVLRDMLRNPSMGLDPVGIVDDDRRKVGRSLHSIPVLGTRAAIPPLVERLRADQVLLAIPSATSDVVTDVAVLCEEADVPLRVLPSVGELVNGRITAKDIRDLQIEDLLGRQQVETDLQAVGALLRGRRVMVTGAGGSIGSEIVRQVARFAPDSICVLDRDETLLHDLVADLPADTPLEATLADIRDRDRVWAAFDRARPDIVFHAAAHKHVPILELHPEEAVQTNVIGAANVAEAAVRSGVSRLVLISTDKAVNPVSIMGISKWLAERVVLSLQGAGCRLCVVRFGNVLGSRGSVIPTFLRQIAGGGPVTVTDPAMSRYFMSVHEAVQLVLQAAALSSGGEVFTLDMGEPVNILSLARKLIRLSGRIPERDVGIAIVGTRPGEKLVEDVVSPDEENVPSSHASIVMSRPAVPDNAALRRAIREMAALASTGQAEELAARMRSLGRSGLSASVGGSV
jgi:FlaA1/EpsC-like NDP-sugar epimerase